MWVIKHTALIVGNIEERRNKMGTNYYHRINICESCSRYDKRHLGKSSGGWEFSFQGYNAEQHQPPLLSFEDWKRKLQADGKIFDEYGKEYSYKEFVELVENKKGGTFNGRPNLNQYDHCKENGYNLNDDWKDPEGHPFTFSEFS